ncbi:hypothetical protein AB3R30_07580 [Leptolyngbyaceae cyanobacterium UHCC 1019]
MTQHRHHIIEHSHQTRCPACHSVKIQTAAQVWAEGTTYGNHQGYALSVGKIRARSVYQTELAAQVNPPIKPEIAQLPFVLWLLYWMPGWIWDLFYCLTGGMSQPQYVRLVITKFITLVIVSLLIFGLQTLINLPRDQQYERDLRRWHNTFVCADCGTCFVKK